MNQEEEKGVILVIEEEIEVNQCKVEDKEVILKKRENKEVIPVKVEQKKGVRERKVIPNKAKVIVKVNHIVNHLRVIQEAIKNQNQK